MLEHLTELAVCLGVCVINCDSQGARNIRTKIFKKEMKKLIRHVGRMHKQARPTYPPREACPLRCCMKKGFDCQVS